MAEPRDLLDDDAQVDPEPALTGRKARQAAKRAERAERAGNRRALLNSERDPRLVLASAAVFIAVIVGVGVFVGQQDKDDRSIPLRTSVASTNTTPAPVDTYVSTPQPTADPIPPADVADPQSVADAWLRVVFTRPDASDTRWFDDVEPYSSVNLAHKIQLRYFQEASPLHDKTQMQPIGVEFTDAPAGSPAATDGQWTRTAAVRVQSADSSVIVMTMTITLQRSEDGAWRVFEVTQQGWAEEGAPPMPAPSVLPEVH